MEHFVYMNGGSLFRENLYPETSLDFPDKLKAAMSARIATATKEFHGAFQAKIELRKAFKASCVWVSNYIYRNI